MLGLVIAVLALALYLVRGKQFPEAFGRAANVLWVWACVVALLRFGVGIIAAIGGATLASIATPLVGAIVGTAILTASAVIVLLISALQLGGAWLLSKSVDYAATPAKWHGIMLVLGSIIYAASLSH